MTEPSSEGGVSTGFVLKLARRALELSQTQLGTKADIDRSVLARLESGDRKIRRSDAEKLGRALFCNEDEAE